MTGALALSAVEQSLVDHVIRGGVLNLALGQTVDEAAMRTWDDTHNIRAVVLRDILRGRLAANPDLHGLQLRAARIVGRLDLEYLTTSVPLDLTECLLDDGLIARYAHLQSLSLETCRIGASNESCLAADGLQVDQDMSLVGMTGNGAGNDANNGGAVRLVGAHISGSLDCSQATITNESGFALAADGLQVDQDMSLVGVTANGACDNSTMRLVGAHISGGLDCSQATITNESGPALAADRLQVDQGMSLVGVTANGAGDDANNGGAVRLVGAHISGSLDCSQATITNESGPALAADRLQVDQDMSLVGVTANGAGDDANNGGAVRLLGAHISGQLDCSQTRMTNESGPALAADGLQVDQDMFLVDVTANGAGDNSTVLTLPGTRVSGTLVLNQTQDLRHESDPTLRLAVDGLTYAGLPAGISADDWLKLLQKGTRYAAQPYQQLAAAHRAAGHDSEARRVLIAQRREQLKRKDPLTGKALASRPERAWGWVTRRTLGYGYQPWRALLCLVAVLLIAVLAALWLGEHGALAHPSSASAPGSTPSQPCDHIERVGVGIDLGLPLIKTFARNRCDLTVSEAGHWLTGIGWTVQVLAWTFATLFVAGLTSAVRKT